MYSWDAGDGGSPVGLSLWTSVRQGMPGGTGPVLRLGREAATLQHARGQLQHEPVDPEHHSMSCENPFVPPTRDLFPRIQAMTLHQCPHSPGTLYLPCPCLV